MQASAGRSHLTVAPRVAEFTRGAIADCTARLADRIGPVTACTGTAEVVAWARAQGLRQVVMHHAPTGPARDALAGLRAGLAADGITLSVQIRAIDALAWPRATAGYFKFRDVLPQIVAQSGTDLDQ